MNDNIKIRTFQAYVSSIFLYNSELWSINRTIAKSIDAFQRRQLRYAIDIFWPKEISNEVLYYKTKVEPWSVTIMRRRLTWLGHLLRLPNDTPARKAFREALKLTKRPRGRPIGTWISTIKKRSFRWKNNERIWNNE